MANTRQLTARQALFTAIANAGYGCPHESSNGDGLFWVRHTAGVFIILFLPYGGTELQVWLEDVNCDVVEGPVPLPLNVPVVLARHTIQINY